MSELVDIIMGNEEVEMNFNFSINESTPYGAFTKKLLDFEKHCSGKIEKIFFPANIWNNFICRNFPISKIYKSDFCTNMKCNVPNTSIEAYVDSSLENDVIIVFGEKKIIKLRLKK